MKSVVFCTTALIIVSFLSSCSGQTGKTTLSADKGAVVGGGCDGCELMYIGMPSDMNSTSISPGWNEKGQKLVITGTVFQPDGKTPAPNVIIYYWQTDDNGYYSPRAGMDERAKRHGHIRGWVTTDKNGTYTIKTIRPAPYPDREIPAHIHLSIKEPDIANEYYPDEINFDDDKLLAPHFKNHPQENRCGSGVVRVLLTDSLQVAEHNLILGLNIPNYPKKPVLNQSSGLSVGEDQPSFTPFHAYGPDKGTYTCPVCKYGRYYGILYFVGNKPDWNEIKSWLAFLEQESLKSQKYLKVYFIYGNEVNYDREERTKLLEQLGTELNIKNMALTFVLSFSDTKSEAGLNKINPNKESTFIIYRHRNIIEKFIDLKPTEKNFELIAKRVNNTEGHFFDLPEPKFY